ncbi:hypothetical protein ABD75_02265 [Bacillus vallismortis]|nr:hypothetical protein [Bacillus vallismortis]QAV08403.1 hypothetical protein BV11031_07170 [Bacillus vallismortis]
MADWLCENQDVFQALEVSSKACAIYTENQFHVGAFILCVAFHPDVWFPLWAARAAMHTYSSSMISF